MSNRRAVTLIELVVVLSILAMSVTIVGLAMRTRPATSGVNLVSAAVASLRDSSIRLRRSLTRTLVISDTVGAVTALPDGRIIADSLVRAVLAGAENKHAAR